MKKSISLKQLVQIALLIAVNVAVARFFIIPVPMTHGNINLCDAGIFIAALLFGRKAGLIVGGLSGFLLDLISGYPQYMFFSLIIHGLEGFLAGWLSEHPSRKALVAAMGTGVLVMVAGYFATDTLLYQLQAGLIGIPTNLFQGVIGGLVALPVYYRLRGRIVSHSK
ncbi:MAG: ECF transporter S component [Liquorilactobacillus nagelii]|nr:ECF transporter S component [Liquorilactobacillus nagelii]KRL41640.1 hypothetical protein FD45_GL000482 [Liquorilactobacillus nagelii DSM 13675]MCC7616563.1 ECF transporter S component [Liquorilactobacillus nagelii]MCI1633903.1 ECF transporter S component [Liquorilactobacillus nagelii]MCI1700459.1 ECF transporter S component [Liquorilactobacillus nagelii]MCI1920887.1 ECF transporter S component [Liquorilactobacillus nagelii]